MLRQYRKRPGQTVRAIRLDLDMPGFHYRKWGADQFAKPGDWLVDNGGDIYTVDAESFARTYRELSPGVFGKSAIVHARRAEAPGQVETREGATHYEAGDYLVFNDADGGDAYAVRRDDFERMYEPVD